MESKMDFHSLSRKELQALCKKNKIPANLTNVAMADALRALDNVEGLDEITRALTSDSQLSPKRTVPGSPDVPRTTGRTSTRRRNDSNEPESSQTLTRTRRTTRRAVTAEANEENNNVNLPETPEISTTRRRKPAASACRKAGKPVMEEVGEEKHVQKENNDAPETPAMQSCRRRAPVTSTRKKMEGQHGGNSVPRVYGTRQSVRLLEKNMAKLSLMEKLRVEHVKIDGLSNEMEDAKEKTDGPEADLLKISTESLKKANDTEDHSFGDLDQSLDNKSETTNEFKEDKKSNDSAVDDYHMNADSGFKKCDNLDGVSRSQAKDVVIINTSIKSELEIEHLENSVDVSHEPLDANDENEALNYSQESVERDLNGIQNSLITDAASDCSVYVTESECGSGANVPDETSAKAMEQIIASEVFPPHETISKVNNVESLMTDSLTTKGSKFLDKSSNINLTEDEQLCDHDFQTEFSIQDECNEIISAEVQQNDNKVLAHDCLLQPEKFHLEQSESRDEPESLKIVSETISCEVQEYDYNVSIQNNDLLLTGKINLEQSESINEIENPKTVCQQEIREEVSDNLVSQSCISNLLPVQSLTNVIESSKFHLEQSESRDEPERPMTVSETISGEVQDYDYNVSVQNNDLLLTEKLQLEQPESINEIESPQTVFQHEIRKEVTDNLVSQSCFGNILPVQSLTNVMESSKFHLEQSESRDEPERSMTFSETISGYNASVQNNDLLLTEKLHLEQSESINEIESPKTVFQHEIREEVSDNLVSQSSVSNILPDQSLTNVMESSKMPELSEASHEPLSLPVSGGKVAGEIAFLPFAADTLQGQFPRPTETTPRKSSTKSLPTTQRMKHASDINKENINSGWKMESGQEKLKKNVIGQEALGDMSLRMLSKMLKEKLEIGNKKNEENKATKVVEETRMALRTLPENCMLSATVPENQKN